MNRYGSDPAPNRLTTSVSTPISPKPRPSSRAANSAATRSTVRPSPGRIPIARAPARHPGSRAACICAIMPIVPPRRHPAATRPASPGWGTLRRTTGASRLDRIARLGGAANVAKVTMPQLGESVAEGTIGKWLKQPGDHVDKYEPLLEVITDKVNAEVPSPFEGILTRDPRPGGRDRPQQRRDRGHRRPATRRAAPAATAPGRGRRAGGAGEAVVRARRRPGRLRRAARGRASPPRPRRPPRPAPLGRRPPRLRRRPATPMPA